MNRFLSLFAIGFLVLLPLSANAQLGMRAGIRAGTNFAGSTSDPKTSSTTTATGQSGLILGAILEKSIFGPIDAQLELLYTQRKFDGGSGDSLTWFDKLDYIQFPLTIKVSGPVAGFKAYGFAGPNLGIRVNSPAPTTIGEPLKNIDFGFDIGGGLEYPIVPLVSLMLDLRYTYGFTDVFNHYLGDGQGTMQSRDVKLLGGVIFGF